MRGLGFERAAGWRAEAGEGDRDGPDGVDVDMAERERDADGTPVPHAALLQVGVGRLADPLTSPDLSGQRDCETEAEEIVKNSRIVVTNEEENDGGEMDAES